MTDIIMWFFQLLLVLAFFVGANAAILFIVALLPFSGGGSQGDGPGA